MKKFRIFALCFSLVCVLLLAGCVKVKELTGDESAKISNYVSYVTIKHSKFGDKTLLSMKHLNELEEEKEEEQSQEVIEPETEENSTETNTEEDATAPKDEPDSNSDSGKIEYTEHEKALGIDGITLSYKGYDVKDAYVLDYFALNSSSGRDLLILKFDILNTTDKDISIDLSKLSPNYEIMINNSGTQSAMSTLLNNDLSMYKGTIKAKEINSGVLVFEMPEKTLSNINSMKLTLEINSGNYNIKL